MNKYQEASRFYEDMLKYWREFGDGKNPSAYAKMISASIELAKLDIDDPFAGRKEEKAAEEKAAEIIEKPEEKAEVKAESKPEPKAEVKNDKPAFKGVYNFKK